MCLLYISERQRRIAAPCIYNKRPRPFGLRPKSGHAALLVVHLESPNFSPRALPGRFWDSNAAVWIVLQALCRHSSLQAQAGATLQQRLEASRTGDMQLRSDLMEGIQYEAAFRQSRMGHRQGITLHLDIPIQQ